MSRSVAVQTAMAIKRRQTGDARTNRGGGDTDETMNKLLVATALALLTAAPAVASAATVTNRDDEAHTLVVTEGSEQVELSIGPGESIEICPTGCFVTMPNGDREVLTGTERLEIEASRGKIF